MTSDPDFKVTTFFDIGSSYYGTSMGSRVRCIELMGDDSGEGGTGHPQKIGMEGTIDVTQKKFLFVMYIHAYCQCYAVGC